MRKEGVGRDGLAVPHDELADEAVLWRGERLDCEQVGRGRTEAAPLHRPTEAVLLARFLPVAPPSKGVGW